MAVVISVIMPFHNSETTLGAAIESLISQNVSDRCEFIFVNDGSNDHSVEVLDYYFVLNPDFEKRSILLNCPFRQGAAAAMALGLRNASGTYIARIDADDEYLSGALYELLSTAESSGADVVAGGIVKKSPGRRDRLLTIKDFAGDLNSMPMTVAYFSLGNKLIRRELIVNNDLYPVKGIDCWEDVSMTARAYALSRKTVLTDKPVYRYYSDPAKPSLSKSHRDLVLRQRLMCALLLEKWFTGRHLDVKYSLFLLNMKFHAKIKLLRGKDCDVVKWRETYPEVNSAIMTLKQNSMQVRLAFWLVDILPSGIAEFFCRVVSRIVGG